MNDMILFVFRELLAEAPLVVVCIGCIVAAVVFWREAPLPSLYVVLACGFTLLLLIMYPVAWRFARALGAQSVGTVATSFKICWSVARSASTILLVVAVYAGRKQR